MGDTTNENGYEEVIITDTKHETDKKCSACGGIMDFDPKTGGLLCPFCGHTEEIVVEPANNRAEELSLESAEKTGNCDWGVATKTILCKSCGGETVYDALQIAGECPYCGSNQVTEAQAQDTLAPGGVCVFRIDKKQAGANFKTWLHKKWFCPKAAKESAKADSFTGLYLPYWTFDAKTYSEYTARYGINRTVRDKDGNTRTTTDWYPTHGIYTEAINDQLVIGTTRQNADILSRIEPFNTEDNVAYKPEYLAGYASERYSTGLNDAWIKAKDFIKRHLTDGIRSKVRSERHADAVDSINFNPVFSDVTYKYLLLPVYLSSFKYKNKIFQFMVNGQTGKVGGKAPVSALRVLLAVLIGLALIALFVYISQYL
jgi:predicted RNA-binding Zn-ribbon protein involved in translation (DUF1610 family)